MANEEDDKQSHSQAHLPPSADTEESQDQSKEAAVSETSAVEQETSTENQVSSSPKGKIIDPPKALGDSHEENLSRKRDREGSVEPSSAVSAVKSPSDVLPTKKNRLLGSVSDIGEKVAEDEATIAASIEESNSLKVGSGDSERVGQIRQRVEELSHDERETKRADLGDKRQLPHRQDPSSVSSSSSSQRALGEKTSVASPVSPAPAAETPSRKQPTFSSFSASSSPFASSSASAGVSGPSWLAGSSSSSSSSSSPSAPVVLGSNKAYMTTSGTSGSSGAIKPSALGGGPPAPTHTDSVSVLSPASSGVSSKSQGTTTTTSAPSSAKSSAGLGFGAFAASRAFGGGGKVEPNAPQAAIASSASPGQSDEGQAVSSPKAGESIFDQQQLTQATEGGVDEPDTEDAQGGEGTGRGKAKMQKVAHGDLATGEEHERTVHSVRAKLYTMSKDGVDGTAADGTWKERGTGTLRVNVSKDLRAVAQKGGARLVMRAEGVLRLILNVSLFRGMKVELAQEKFVRIVALEEDKLVHFAIKVSNPSAAYELFRAVKHHIPALSPIAVAAAAKNGLIGEENKTSAPPALPARIAAKPPTTAFAFHKDDQGEKVEPRGDEAV